MKISIRVDISNEQKKQFMALQHMHGQTFTDALESGMDSIIAKTHSIRDRKFEITKKELELNKLRAELDAVIAEQNKSAGDQDFSFGDEYDIIIQMKKGD